MMFNPFVVRCYVAYASYNYHNFSFAFSNNLYIEQAPGSEKKQESNKHLTPPPKPCNACVPFWFFVDYIIELNPKSFMYVASILANPIMIELI
jgi:hypothetical protein